MKIVKTGEEFIVTLADGTKAIAHKENPSPLARILYQACEELHNLHSMVQKNKCPECEEGILIEFSSLNEKLCDTCEHKEPWKLKPGQPSKY